MVANREPSPQLPHSDGLAIPGTGPVDKAPRKPGSKAKAVPRDAKQTLAALEADDAADANAASGTSADDDATAAAKKKARTRTSRACDQCNLLRTKCDGAQPCGHCVELNFECKYLRVPLKRGKASETYLKGIRRRAAMAAATTASGVTPISTTNPPPTQFHPTNANPPPPPPPSQPQPPSAEFPANASNSSTSSASPGVFPMSHPMVHMLGNSDNGSPLGMSALSHYSPGAFTSSTGMYQFELSPIQTHASTAAPQDSSHRKQDSGGSHHESQDQQPQGQTAENNAATNAPVHGSNTGHPPNPATDTTSAESENASNGRPNGQNSAKKDSFMVGSPFSLENAFNGNHGEIRRPSLSSFSPLLEHSPNSLLGIPNAPSPWFQSAPVDNRNFNGGPEPVEPSNTSTPHSQNSHSASPGAVFRRQQQPLPGQNNIGRPRGQSGLPALSPGGHTPNSGQAYLPANVSRSDSDGRSPQTISGMVDTVSSTDSRYNGRYPMLDTIAHLLDPIPMSLAEDLLEEYFSHSTHVLAYLVRRSSVLSPIRPRRTSYSLIFAMLLVAAHHSDNPLLTGTPSSRANVVSRLTKLTIDHLSTVTELTAPGTLDDVITYVQIATIVSASEYKGTSLRWWANAWDLAKELKLNREIPGMSPETREEQRRTWWLLYMVDRHLGLCYNRPLAILDSECMEIYRPCDEQLWESDIEITAPEMDPSRIKGVCHIVTGQGIYGYFLPLMSILGTLVEIHHLEQNPLLQLSDIGRQMRSSVRSFLDQYTASVKNWNPVPCQHAYQNAWRDYAFQLIHVFHILYSVPWDPIEMLEFSESLMLNPEFGKVTNHAIAAVKSIRRILTIDPDLMLMPFFFGIYLLQGSFVFLAIVDRVESEASQEVVSACETIVHAHEVCIVTLNTEYQRNFRRIMRTTMGLLQSDASNPTLSSDLSKEEARRKQHDVLGLYRWVRGGRGLAVQ